MRKTKIVCTIGPSSSSVETIKELIKAGMNVARINFSHGGIEENGEKIENVKIARSELNMPVALMLDTKGPEIRTGKVENDMVMLEDGETFTFVTDEILGNKNAVTVSYKELYKEVGQGAKILIDDGKIETVVEYIDNTNIVCRVTHGGKLCNRKSVNVPGAKLNLPGLSEKDINDIKGGIAAGIDYIAASFVRRAQDVYDIRKLLDENGGSDVKIISKIENREGIDNFDEILAVSDGIMVARGDLSVEIPMAEVPIWQKQFIKKCFNAGKLVITATQMLESMINNPRPTRAEVSDVANAIFDMSSAIMLSGETATGKYPVECVKTMDNIASTIEESIRYWVRFKNRETDFTTANYEFNINHSICDTAMNMNAAAIVTYTEAGNTPRMISSFTPKCPIYAVTTNERTYKQLALSWNVYPIILEQKNTINELLIEAVQKIKAEGQLKDGDDIVIAGGSNVIPSLSRGETMNRIIGGVLKV
ncbi:MAG: pyruvate kinase [Clostridia bacterium]|nr:pyruvate kinase [Clostridia bacterium]